MNPRFIEETSWRMGEVYGAVTDRILINLAKYFPYIRNGKEALDAFNYQARMLAQMGQVNRETADIIARSLEGADEALRNALEDAITDALEDAEPELRKAAEKGLLLGGGFVPPEMAPNQMQAFQAFYSQAADRLNLVNTVMLESTQQAYSATVSDIVARIERTQGFLNVATGEVVSGVSTLNEAVSDAVKKMLDNGITGFIDHGNHKWSPEAYVTMDVRTTMGNTARQAVFEREEQYGNDLYQVSHHDGARPLCYPWQGKVISREDRARVVQDYEGNNVRVYAQSETSYGEAAGLFGINCGHYPIPFVPSFSRIRSPEQNEEENAKAYAESQKQRELERELRSARRDLSVEQARKADAETLRYFQNKVDEAENNLDSFCDETGRSRRRSREYTPIKPTWPDE